MLRWNRLVPFLALALAAFVTPALADMLTLHGGAQLEGKVVEQRGDEIVFEHVVGGAHVRSVFSRGDIEKFEVDLGTRAAAASVAGVTSSRFPELKDVKRRFAIVLDRSGSMSIGDRYATALDEIDKLLAAAPDGVGVSVYAFDRRPLPVTDTSFWKLDDATRKKLHDKLEGLGVNRLGYTDLVAGLAPALAAEPEAIFLFSDGVPTIGEPSASAVLKGLREKLALLPSKNVLIHVVALHGGRYEWGKTEDPDGARAVLRAIALATGGTLREVEAQPRPQVHLALTPPPERVPPLDPVKFHFYTTEPPAPSTAPAFAHEFFLPEVSSMNFVVEVEDPALVQGPVVLEYAAVPAPPRIVLRSYTRSDPAHELFDEKKDLEPLVAHQDGQPDLSRFQMLDDIWLGTSRPQQSATVYARPGVLRLYQRIHVVRGLDDNKRGPNFDDQSDRWNAYIKLPMDNGTLDVIYERGNRTYKHTFFIDSPLGPGQPTPGRH